MIKDPLVLALISARRDICGISVQVCLKLGGAVESIFPGTWHM